MRILVTGGAGFIGSALVHQLIGETEHEILVVDKLTYAGVAASLDPVRHHPRFEFAEADIADAAAVRAVLDRFAPDLVTHLAAESHVDRSIDGPGAFIATNVVGTFVLLEEVLRHWRRLPAAGRERFRFHHVSTDEVFGSLGPTGSFTEQSRYDPRSPYSASKAASDHLVRAWHETYGLPTLVTNCSNNYGPRQFPEKLIPLVILRALAGQELPVYGDGRNVRDWLHVDDHARALRAVFERGEPGETYNVGGRAERTTIEVVRQVCAALDAHHPRAGGGGHADLVRFVADRPGHDRRYAIDPGKIETALGWRARETFESGIDATVRWYLANRDWWAPLAAGGDATRRLGIAPS